MPKSASSIMAAKMHVATLGLGGNIGDPVAAMAAVIDRLAAAENIALLAVSKLYRTPPWGKLDQPDFYNACIKIETSLTPIDLLDFGLALESELKRERIERWGPRTIDIDVLTYNDQKIECERLILPHPRMHDRAFVLMPLKDVAADLVIQGKPVDHWLTSVDQTGIEAVSDEQWWKR